MFVQTSSIPSCGLQAQLSTVLIVITMVPIYVVGVAYYLPAGVLSRLARGQSK